jgi:hypothetical protein
MAPAIYLLDDNQEATGTVYHFCSESCRERYRVQEGPLAFGERMTLLTHPHATSAAKCSCDSNPRRHFLRHVSALRRSQ